MREVGHLFDPLELSDIIKYSRRASSDNVFPPLS